LRNTQESPQEINVISHNTFSLHTSSFPSSAFPWTIQRRHGGRNTSSHHPSSKICRSADSVLPPQLPPTPVSAVLLPFQLPSRPTSLRPPPCQPRSLWPPGSAALPGLAPPPMLGSPAPPRPADQALPTAAAPVRVPCRAAVTASTARTRSPAGALSPPTHPPRKTTNSTPSRSSAPRSPVRLPPCLLLLPPPPPPALWFPRPGRGGNSGCFLPAPSPASPTRRARRVPQRLRPSVRRPDSPGPPPRRRPPPLPRASRSSPSRW
jgi:hypothetical protein